MNPSLSSRINDEHRRDLLREARVERLAQEARQPQTQASIAESPQTGMRAPLVSVDMLLLLKSLTHARRERIAFSGDEAL